MSVERVAEITEQLLGFIDFGTPCHFCGTGKVVNKWGHPSPDNWDYEHDDDCPIREATELLALLPQREVEGWSVTGFVHRGPDFNQDFRGWVVHAQKQPGIDVPVTLTYLDPEEE